MPPTFGHDYLMPMLPAFLERYPDVQLDLGFENRQVDLIGEGVDAAIGGGMELPAGSWPGAWRRCMSSPWLRRNTCEIGRLPAAAARIGHAGRAFHAVGPHRTRAGLEDAQPRRRRDDAGA
jgi:DNA-binding transcriptional LysR family regulator